MAMVIDCALEYLHDLDRGARFSALKFEDLISSLQAYAVRRGFSEEILNELILLWLNIKIPVTKWNALGNCMIPEGKVSDETVQTVIRWILSNHYSDDKFSKVAAALNWLTGLLDYNLLNADILDPFYEFFFFFLDNDKYSLAASKLVYYYTKSKDVTRSKAIEILNLIGTIKSPKKYNCLLVLLSLFKSYRPELVPEDIPIVPINVAFGKPNKLLMERLEDAQIRSKIQQNIPPQIRLSWWTGESATRNIRNQNNIHLTPDLDFIELGSSIYTKDHEKKKCLDFTSTHDLLAYHFGHEMQSPANILSLMVNDAGLHLLHFSDRRSQERLSQTLYHTLHNNYLTNRSRNKLTFEEKILFLRKVSLLQLRLQQGIPVVSRFLAQFIPSWSGLEYQDEIFDLLEWICCETFDELFDLILEPIERLFLTNSVSYQCRLLETLKQMYKNLHTMMTSKRTLLFLNRPSVNNVEILKNLPTFVDELCEKSLIMSPDSEELRECFLDFYETVADLQAQVSCQEVLWSVLPPCLAYGTLCSHNGFAINRILGVFLKYREIYEKIKETHGKNAIKFQITLTQNYSTDFVNALWYGRSVSCAHQGLMLKSLPPCLVKQLEGNISKFDKLLDIKHHAALAHYTSNKVLPSENFKYMNEEFWLNAIGSFFENIPKFTYKMIELSKEPISEFM